MRWSSSSLALLALILIGCGDFTRLGEGLDEALFSVQGHREDLWIVGANRGSGPAVYHLDGGSALASWERLEVPVEADLWWVLPLPSEVIAVGTEGTLVELDRSSGEWAQVEGPDSSHTFYGVWGASSEEIWAVGGRSSGGEEGVVWRRRQGIWEQETDSTLLAASNGAVWFKVHGQSPDRVWLVGSQGRALLWDGSQFSAAGEGLQGARLFTVVDGLGGTLAVGTNPLGGIWEQDEGAWVSRGPELAPSLSGVCWAGGEVDAYAVGELGAVVERRGGDWSLQAARPTAQDFHACWADEEGNVLAVGGHITGAPFNNGMAYARGPANIPVLAP